MNLLDSIVSALRPYPFRGKLKLLDPIVPRSGLRDATVHGQRMRLDLGESIQRWIYMGAFEPGETAIVRQSLRPGGTFLDVGANVGYFTLLAASQVGDGGRVYAIEPSPQAFNALDNTARANGLAQVSAFQMGLSDEAGELPLFVQADESGFHSPTMADGGGEAVVVPVSTLDQLFRDESIQSVDLMKMDVEGHETRILNGGRQVLAEGRVHAVLSEFNGFWLEKQGSSARELHSRFLDLGFVDTRPTDHFDSSTFETRLLIHRTRA